MNSRERFEKSYGMKRPEIGGFEQDDWDSHLETWQAAERQALERFAGPLEMVLGRYDAIQKHIGGCSDGACVIDPPTGMHTNGGCRCPRDARKMQQATYAALELRKSLRTILQDAQSGEDQK